MRSGFSMLTLSANAICFICIKSQNRLRKQVCTTKSGCGAFGGNFSLVRRHLEFSSTVWNPTDKCDIDTIERIQCNATKMITGFWKLSYSDRLAKLGLTDLTTHRRRGDLIQAFKIKNDLDFVDCRIFQFVSESKYDRASFFNSRS